MVYTFIYRYLLLFAVFQTYVNAMNEKIKKQVRWLSLLHHPGLGLEKVTEMQLSYLTVVLKNWMEVKCCSFYACWYTQDITFLLGY